jgi:hypothetical protein
LAGIGNSGEGGLSNSFWLKIEASSLAGGGTADAISAREFRWGKHMEAKKKITPTAKFLRVIKFIMKAQEKCKKRSKEKKSGKKWHMSVGFVKKKSF